MRHHAILKGNPLGFRGGFFGLSSAVLVETPIGPALVDTGHHGNRPALLAGLRERGLGPDDVPLVVLTHLHFDHCNNIDLFRRARVFVSRREWDYARAPHPDDLFVPWLIHEQLARHDLVLLDDEGEIAPGLAHFAAPGHTPGLQALAFTNEAGERVVIASDAIKTAREALSARCDMAFDTIETGTATIRAILARADRIVPGHHPELVRRDGTWLWDGPAGLDLIVR